MTHFNAWLGRMATGSQLAPTLRPLAGALLDRRFSRQARVRVQIHATHNRIAFSQVYPFLRFADHLRRTEGVEVRCSDIDALLAGDAAPRPADVVLVQPWFTVNRAALTRALAQIRKTSPGARIILLDPCAHNDLRLARDVDPHIDLYVSKSLFRDRARHLAPTLGDTNLTEFFGCRFGHAEAERDWQVPGSILPKLRLGAGFVTAPGLLEGFLARPPDLDAARPIDLHARLATDGSAWYAAMRAEALVRAREVPGRIVTETGVTRRAFMRELGQSRMVFSPFGYGELCWRDVEGFLTGAVVVKQDMGHLDTRPDLFRPWETYVPVRWDLSDFGQNIARLRRDDGLRKRIAAAAFHTARTYLAARLPEDLRTLLVAPVMTSVPAEEPSPRVAA